LTFGELDLIINRDKCMDQKPAMCSSPHPSPSAARQLLLTLFLIEAGRGWTKNSDFTTQELGVKRTTIR